MYYQGWEKDYGYKYTLKKLTHQYLFVYCLQYVSARQVSIRKLIVTRDTRLKFKFFYVQIPKYITVNIVIRSVLSLTERKVVIKRWT